VWCTPCMLEMPSLKELQASLRDREGGIIFLFVSIKPNFFEKDSAWLKQSGLAGMNVRWDDRTREQYHAFFQISNSKWWVPNSLVLDRSGNVVKWVRGSGTDWTASTGLILYLMGKH
jgi:thiol-disulfide isomerase/thioredoxin